MSGDEVVVFATPHIAFAELTVGHAAEAVAAFVNARDDGARDERVHTGFDINIGGSAPGPRPPKPNLETRKHKNSRAMIRPRGRGATREYLRRTQ